MTQPTVSKHSWRQRVPILYNRPPFPLPQNCPYGSFGPPSSHPKRYLDRFSHFWWFVYDASFIIRLEARLQLNIGFTSARALTVFTRSDITPPKVNRFGWNLERAEYIVWGWPWQIWARSAQYRELESEAKFCFLSGKQHTILPISRRPNFAMRRWMLSEQNFENFPVKTEKFDFFPTYCHFRPP